jgi:hypothetical protein
MEQLVLIKSKPKNNFFAPEWCYYIYENIINNIDFNHISNLILKKEKEIIKKYTPSKKGSVDGYTGLGKNSLTSRYEHFNLLKWNDVEINKLEKQIIEKHNKFIKSLNLDIPKKLYIQCWANVMRKGEQIKPHIHFIDPDTYLGGHICVKCANTSTNYINPVNQLNDPEIYESKNKVGKISLFQNCIPHYTSIHKLNSERITIAFDLYLNNNNKNNNYKQII